jgi:spore coat protein CotF
MAARMAMMAMTTNSSIKVKALFMDYLNRHVVAPQS